LTQHTTSELILNPIIFFQRGYSKIPFVIFQCFFQKAYAIFIIFWHDNIRIYLWRFQSLAQYLDMRVHILRFSLSTQNLALQELIIQDGFSLSISTVEKTNSIVESTNKKDFIISIKYSNWSSGGVVAIKAAQSGQALRPFESQIPGSNPGRSISYFWK
jgi:hypothetical protein